MAGQRSNQLNYDPAFAVVVAPLWGTSPVSIVLYGVTNVVGSAGLEPATSCL